VKEKKTQLDVGKDLKGEFKGVEFPKQQETKNGKRLAKFKHGVLSRREKGHGGEKRVENRGLGDEVGGNWGWERKKLKEPRRTTGSDGLLRGEEGGTTESLWKLLKKGKKNCEGGSPRRIQG